MSTATELLRRALESLEEMNASLESEFGTPFSMWRSPLIIKEIRAFLAAEPEAEYDFYGVIPLTHRKAKGIIKDRGYNVTGFVLTENVAENKCIVDMSAVRWLTGKEFFEMMHPPVVSPTAEPEAEPVAYMDPYHGVLMWAKAPEYAEHKGVSPEEMKLLPLYTKPSPSRKPMTEEEMADSGEVPHCEWDGFVAGVRFAEKHHGIGGDDE